MKFLVDFSEHSVSILLEILRTTSNVEMLTYYSKSEYLRDREMVAANPNTPKDILDKLVFDSALIVRKELVKNPSILPISLDRLYDTSTEEFIIVEIAKHKNTSKETLQKIEKNCNYMDPKVIAVQRLKKL